MPQPPKAKRSSLFLIILVACLVLIGAAFLAFKTVPAIQDRVMQAMVSRGMSEKPAPEGDALEVALCGSGSPLPDPNRAQACTLIAAGGRFWVVDTGIGSTKQIMLMRRFTADKLAAIMLTHFHSDHIGDLGELAMQSWVQGRPDRLKVYGGPGIERVAAGFNEAYALDATYRTGHHGPKIAPPERHGLEAVVVAAPDGAPLAKGQSVQVLKDGDMTITAFAVTHDPITPAYGYRFDYRGRSVVVTGDTKEDPNIALAAKDADVLVHEAQARNVVALMRDGAKAAGNERRAQIFHDIDNYHTSPAEAAEIGRDAKVKLLVLTHLTPAMPQFIADIVFGDPARAVKGPQVVVGKDRLTVRLPVGSDKVEIEN
jgi:ribonuclease Z